MQREVAFAPDEYFHIYNRGAHKADIFLDDADYRRFVSLLYVANNTEVVHLSNFDRSRDRNELFAISKPERLVDIGAYCLMPNHFHLLVRSRSDTGVSIFMKKLLTGYSMFFNKKHEHPGTVFSGRFKAQHANDDRYLKYLFAYIHLNPLSVRFVDWKKKGIGNKKVARDFLRSYAYSSYLDYTGVQRPQSSILTTEEFPKYFKHTKDFSEFLDDWLAMSRTDLDVKVGP